MKKNNIKGGSRRERGAARKDACEVRSWTRREREMLWMRTERPIPNTESRPSNPISQLIRA